MDNSYRICTLASCMLTSIVEEFGELKLIGSANDNETIHFGREDVSTTLRPTTITVFLFPVVPVPLTVL